MFHHPQQVCMTYIQHMQLSLGLSFLFFKGFIKAFVHSFWPDIFVTSSSDIQLEIATILKKNGCRD